MTQNDFLGFMYSRVAALPAAARRPSQDNLLNRWSLIVAWTNFCTTRTVPRNNLSDLLRYSAVKLTAITCTSQCPADPNASCQQLFEACVNSPLNVVADPWSEINCVLAAICRGRAAFGEQLACATDTTLVDMETYPRLTQAMFNRLSFGDDIISRQNFLDSYYGALARLPSPQWPDVNYVLARWKVIEDRTGFYDGNIALRYISEWLRWM
ncbi:hypothetical protein ONZ45_g14149 [Pleurotus djamor]|nr:hypothetical protein ONZ45_g14149 [Pleurotus djamor]